MLKRFVVYVLLAVLFVGMLPASARGEIGGEDYYLQMMYHQVLHAVHADPALRSWLAALGVGSSPWRPLYSYDAWNMMQYYYGDHLNNRWLGRIEPRPGASLPSWVLSAVAQVNAGLLSGEVAVVAVPDGSSLVDIASFAPTWSASYATTQAFQTLHQHVSAVAHTQAGGTPQATADVVGFGLTAVPLLNGQPQEWSRLNIALFGEGGVAASSGDGGAAISVVSANSNAAAIGLMGALTGQQAAAIAADVAQGIGVGLTAASNAAGGFNAPAGRGLALAAGFFQGLAMGLRTGFGLFGRGGGNDASCCVSVDAAGLGLPGNTVDTGVDTSGLSIDSW